MRSTCATAWFRLSGEVVSQCETPLALPLESTEADQLQNSGKGASLARMAAAGLYPADST
jgi:hypothetical protein